MAMSLIESDVHFDWEGHMADTVKCDWILHTASLNADILITSLFGKVFEFGK